MALSEYWCLYLNIGNLKTFDYIYLISKYFFINRNIGHYVTLLVNSNSAILVHYVYFIMSATKIKT